MYKNNQLSDKEVRHADMEGVTRLQQEGTKARTRWRDEERGNKMG